MVEPRASGTLKQTPLPHLLIYLDQQKLSGTLAVWPDVVDEGSTGQDRILMLKGKPVACRLVQQASSLHEGLLPLFQRTQAPYAFYDGNLLGGTEDRLNGRVDSLALITQSLRATSRDDVVAKVLGRYDGLKLRLQPKVELARYEFEADEQALVQLLQAEPASVEQLLEYAPLDPERARRLLYLLAISKAVAPYEEPGTEKATAPAAAPAAPAATPAATPSAPVAPAADGTVAAGAAAATTPEPPATATVNSSIPPEQYRKVDIARDSMNLTEIPNPAEGLDEEVHQRWILMVTKGKLIENQNYFEMLGLERTAAASDARAAFFKLAKQWHPDRLPKEMDTLKPYAEVIFGFMSEAHSTLSNEQSRIKYIQTVREGGGTPATDKLMEAILDSAMQYERVLVMTRKHEYDGALELLNKILAVTKDEPDYHAMQAWLMMKKFPGDEAPLKDMLETCDVALKLHDRHERAQLYRAQILKRMGRNKEALRHFKKVVEINPRNVDAAREVRVANMRGQRSDTGPMDQGGLLGKLFKKK